MSINAQLQANVRTTAPELYGSGVSNVDQTPRGELLTAFGLPPKTDIVRLGNSWTLQTATGSAFTNVANMPTTLAVLGFYNAYTDTTCAVIDQIWFLSLTSITALSNVTIIYQVASVAALTNDTAQLINSPTGKTYSGSMTRAINVTTMVANKWACLAAAGCPATATIGLGCVAEVRGGIVIKPGFTLGVNAVLGTATGTSLMGISWHEMKLPLV